MTHASPLLPTMLLAIGCGEFGLENRLSALADTGEQDLPHAERLDPDTGETRHDTEEPGEDTAAPPCHAFTFRWTPPLSGALSIQGEFSAVDGAVTVPWQTWPSAMNETTIWSTWSLCDPIYLHFRGEGILDLDGDSDGDCWSCTRQRDGSFAVTGTVEFTLDGQPLPVETAPDPESAGCGVATSYVGS